MKKIYDFYFPEWDNHFENFFNKDRGYQEAQRNRALAHVVEFEVAVDCGAHVGLWSRDLSVFFDKLYCFEPVKEFFECLKSNILSKNVEFYNSALGKEFSQGEILITKNSGNSGQTHLIKDKKKKYEKDDIIQKIEILHLDNLNLNKLDFFKIDVEGLGFDVLQGSKKTLKVCNPVVCIELFESKEKKEQMSFLESLGYNLVDVIIKEHIFLKNS
jgi:FkbM family methyltransferase